MSRIDELTGQLSESGLDVYQGWMDWIGAIAEESARRAIPTEDLTTFTNRVFPLILEKDGELKEDLPIFKLIDQWKHWCEPATLVPPK